MNLSHKAIRKHLTAVANDVADETRVYDKWSRSQIRKRWPGGRYDERELKKANLRPALESLPFRQV